MLCSASTFAIFTESGSQALTLDCGNHWSGGPVNQKIHWPPKKSTGPPKTCNDPNVFAAGIYDFKREVAHFCTLDLCITKNKYELTLLSEFCRFPVKIMAAYEALTKKTKKTSGQWKINCGGPKWPDSLKNSCGQRAHSQCQGLRSPICVSYASRKCLTAIGMLVRRMSLTCSDHAMTVGPIRFSNRSNNCRVCKINERRSSLVRTHHETIFVVSASNKR